MIVVGKQTILRYVARLAGGAFGIVAAAFLATLSVYAVGKDQRKIFDWGIPYHNIEACVSSSGGAIGDNKDYEGNQILTDDDLEKVKKYQPVYQKIASKHGMPWQIFAAIHYRESSLKHGSTINSEGQCEGPYGISPGESWLCGNEYDDEKFEKVTERLATDLEEKLRNKGGGSWDDPNVVMEVLFRYNGMAGVYIRQGRNLGFDEAGAMRGEGSPYVANMLDEKRDPTKNGSNWGQVKRDYGPIEYPANKDYGAFVVYRGLGGGSGSSSGGASIEKRIEERAFWVGDKRAIGLQNAGGKNDKDIWVTDENDGYDWFVNTAINQVSGQLKESEGQAQNSQDQSKDKKDKDKDKDKKGDTIVFALGVNDMVGGAKRYTDKLKELVADNGAWAKARKVLVVSVNPVLESKTQVKNADVEDFNSKLKNGISNNKKLEFIDVYAKFKKDIKDTDFEDDGISYKSELNKKIYEFIRDGDPDRNKNQCDSSSGDNPNIDGYVFPYTVASGTTKQSDLTSWYGAAYPSDGPTENGGDLCHQSWVDKGICHHGYGQSGDGTDGALDLTVRESYMQGPGYKPRGESYLAIYDGTIKSIKQRNGLSNCADIMLAGDDGWVYWYGHGSDWAFSHLKVGQMVKAGDKINEMGVGGCADSTSPHEHIDRGFPKGENAGRVGHRDPDFPKLMNKLFKSLPQ